MRSFNGSVLAAVALIAFPTLAEKPIEQKTPEQWTDDERFAARFAEGAPKARLAVLAKHHLLPQQTASGDAKFLDVVDGAAEPHLFFPIEVLRTFVDRVLPPPNREASAPERASLDNLMSRAHDAGLPTDLQALIAREGSAYQALRVSHAADVSAMIARRPRRGDAVLDHDIRAIQDSYDRQQCRAIHALMELTKGDLGEAQYARFLTFLYREVAPQMLILSQREDSSLEVPLRAYVGGCQ